MVKSKQALKYAYKAIGPAIFGYEVNDIIHETQREQVVYQNQAQSPNQTSPTETSNHEELLYIIIIMLIAFIGIIAVKLFFKKKEPSRTITI